MSEWIRNKETREWKSQGFQSLGREGRVSLCPGEKFKFWAWGAMEGYGKTHKATPSGKGGY